MKRHLLRVAILWAALGIIVGLFSLGGVKMSHLTRDPAQLMHTPVYKGFLSNMGALIWCAAAVAPFFASFLARNADRPFLRWIALINLVLMADDFFLLHDVVFPLYLHLPEKLMVAFHPAALGIYLVYYRRRLLRGTEWRLLALAVGVLGISQAVDFNLLPGGIDVEDGFKLGGMIVWTYYWCLTAWQIVMRRIECAESGAVNPSPVER